jgi:glycosyltransferase involved in cell wall biosynthesis
MEASHNLKVSVIIPVYNAEPFLRRAVEAAEAQEVVKEIILVEDCSPDDSWELCQKLSQEYHKVKAHQHPDKQNHGCGATRNYGFTLASYDYITFADADNYILPNRYDKDVEIFKKYPDADGVYNCMGIHYYSETSKKQFLETVKQEILTFSQPVAPEEVPLVFLSAHPDNVEGTWGIDALTIKRSLFKKSGLFNTQLKLQQDMDLFIKMSMVGRFYLGEIVELTCIRGVHDQQRSTNKQQQDLYGLQRWKSLKQWLKNNNEAKRKYGATFDEKHDQFLIQATTGFKSVLYLIKFAFKYPKELKKPYGAFDFGFWKVFGKNVFTIRIISFKNRYIFRMF